MTVTEGFYKMAPNVGLAIGCYTVVSVKGRHVVD